MVLKIRREFVSTGHQLLRCRKYAIKAYSATQTTPQNTTPINPQSTPPQLLAQAFHLYKANFQDKIVLSQISRYESLKNESIKTIKVGVVYDGAYIAKNSKIIEAILADPLALGNKEWFDLIANRDRKVNNTFKYPSLTSGTTKSLEFIIPSPILSSEYRPSYSKAFDSETMIDADKNNIELVEINSEPIDCHFYVNVTSDVTNASTNLDPQFAKKIVLTIIDNSDFTPSSTEDSAVSFTNTSIANHVIKVDSNLCLEGIEQFLELDVKAGTQLVDSLINSNIFEVRKSLGWYLGTNILSKLLLQNIYTSILKDSNESNVTSVTNTLFDDIQKSEIIRFGELVHSELQYDFIPNTETFFKKDLRWWKMYWKNDNVEYDLKDYFGKYFMPKSIEYYNFLRGKIVSQMQLNRYGYYNVENEIGNPLLEMKTNLINTRVSTEIQPVVFQAITTGFIYYQLPVSIISFLSYQYFDFSANSAVALGLLGIVLGFNHASRIWENFTKVWVQQLFEDVRLCLGKQCIDEGLLKELDVRFKEEIQLTTKSQNILASIQKELD